MSVARRGIMPKQEVVEIENRDYEIRHLNGAYNKLFGFPKANYNLGQLSDLLETRLENQNQKNALRAYMNAIANDETGTETLNAVTVFSKFLKDELDTRGLMSELSRLSKSSVEQATFNSHDNLDIVIEYAEEELKKLNKGEKKEPVKKISFNDIKTMKHEEVLDEPQHEINIDKLNLDEDQRDKFIESKYDVETIRVMIEGKLKSDNQKKVVRAVLNGCSKKGFDCDGFLKKFIKHSNALINGDKLASTYMEDLDKELKYATHFSKHRPFLSEAGELASKEANKKTLGNASKVNGFLDSMDSQKNEFPAVSRESCEFFHTITADAKNAKSGIRNSKQYKSFYTELKKASELMDNLYLLSNNGGESIRLTGIKNKDLKTDLLPFAKDGKVIKREDIMTAYQQTMENVKKYAKDYENYKFKTKTEDKKREPGKKLVNSDDKRKLKLTAVFTGKTEYGAYLKENSKKIVL